MNKFFESVRLNGEGNGFAKGLGSAREEVVIVRGQSWLHLGLHTGLKAN